jgi:hypothetical protein
MMIPSTTIAAAHGQLIQRRTHRPGCRADQAPVASALGQYEQSQSRFTILPDPVRHALLELGDRLRGLSGALRSAEPSRDPGTDSASESLIVPALRDALDPLLGVLECEIGYASTATWRVASRYFHERFGALVDLSPFAGRCFHKPLGYAGDFEMMNIVYRNESLGGTLFGRSLSRVVLDSDAGCAVRHRANYLARKIEAAIAHGERHRPVRILSVAAGPAIELQLLLRSEAGLLQAGRVEIVLIDQDGGALEHASQRIQALAARAGVDVAVRCIKTSISSVIADGLDNSYDLVYSAGLFDYLKDRAARAAGARLVAALTPGGQAVIGNFDVANPTRPFMELILDWPLYHRSAGDLRGLFGDMGTSIAIEQEATGVNLFAVIGA